MAENQETKKTAPKKKGRPKKVKTEVVAKPVPVKRVRTPRNDLVEREAVVNFKAWFVNMLGKDKRLKEHHYEQLRLYMKGLGLKDLEPSWKFEMGLRQYYGG
jgi:hypothetical protein